MIATGSLAFGNARVRALKSRLLGREIAGRVVAGLPAPRDRPLDSAGGFRELSAWYVTVLKSYPRGQPFLLALLRRHELENIKLAWRAIVNHINAAEWSRYWIDLGRLATIDLERCRDCRTLAALAAAVRRTPFAEITEAMFRAHAGDLLAAELGFDRWMSRVIAGEAALLPAADRTAAELASAVVRERDFNVMRRLSEDLPAEFIKRRGGAIVDWQQGLLWWRRRRRELCRRAFRESAFSLAPAVALLLLKEEEVRGLEAVYWFERSRDLQSLEFALAASELGA